MVPRLLVLLLVFVSSVLTSFPAWAQSPGSLVITNLQNSAGTLSLGWQSSTTGTTYTVEFQDTVQDGIWRLPESLVPFPVESNSWTNVSTNESRFFRVVAVPAAQRGTLLSSTLNSTLSTTILAFLFS